MFSDEHIHGLHRVFLEKHAIREILQDLCYKDEVASSLPRRFVFHNDARIWCDDDRVEVSKPDEAPTVAIGVRSQMSGIGSAPTLDIVQSTRESDSHQAINFLFCSLRKGLGC